MNPAPETTTTMRPGGDSRSLDEYFEAFTQTIPPRSAAERELIEQAARACAMHDHVVALQTQRITANIASAAQRVAEEIERQIERLFHHRGGPIEEYGSRKRSGTGRRAPAVRFVPFDEPAILVHKLEQSSAGIRALTNEWAELRALLDRGSVWNPQHKLKATRLLGRQPWDAMFYGEVLDILYASWLLDPRRGNPFSEIAIELGPEEFRRFMNTVRVDSRNRLEQLRQHDARRVLLAIVVRALDRLKAMLPAAQERAERDAACEAACLSFDFSAEGERLRRSEQKYFDSFHRALDQLVKLHQHPRTPESAAAERPDQSDAGSGAGTMTAVEDGLTSADQERLEPSDSRPFAAPKSRWNPSRRRWGRFSAAYEAAGRSRHRRHVRASGSFPASRQPRQTPDRIGIVPHRHDAVMMARLRIPRHRCRVRRGFLHR